MKLKNIIIASLVMACTKANAQSFAINTTGAAAHNSAILDVTSTSKGMLVPRVSTAQRTAITAPAKGLLVYDSTVNQFAYYDGTAWLMLNAGGSSWTVSGTNQYSNVTGNVGIGVTAPATRLHVASNNTATTATIESGTLQYPTALSILPSTHAVSRRSSIKLDDWQVLQDFTGTGNKDFSIYQGATGQQRLTINTNGNMGIGATAPTEKLEVAGKTKTTNLQITTGAINGYVLQSDAAGNGSWVNPTALPNNDWSLTGNSNATAGTHFIGTLNNQAIDFRANNIIKARLTTKGQLEILNTGRSVFMGEGAGQNDDLALNANVFLGYWAGKNNKTGFSNVSIGSNALMNDTTGEENTVTGYFAMGYGYGSRNTAIGAYALYGADGTDNTALGHSALINSLGNNNIGIGSFVLEDNVFGNANTAIGFHAGQTNIGSGNVFLGNLAGQNEQGSNKLYIDNTNTATPLIHGNFATNHLIINDSLTSKYLQMTNGATNGYVLQSDAMGNAAWVNPTALPITETDPQVSSTGNNYIPRWNGSTLADGAIYDDSTNVGIGLVPSKRFQVYMGVAATAAVSVSQTVGGNFVSGNVPQWQSFTAVTAGATDKVTLRFWATPAVTNRTVSIYKGQGTSGALLYTGSPVAVPIAAAGVDVDFPIPGITLVAGQQYTIAIDNGARWLMSASNPYTTGISSFNSANDYRFELYLFANNPGFSVSNAGVSINDYTLPFADGAANQVLQTNGAGVTAWVNSTALAVTETDPQVASATVNKIPKWNGTALADGLITDDGTNIGIGTTAPTAKLHVKGIAVIDSGRIEFINTGNSIFIGKDAGRVDDRTVNDNVFIGLRSGFESISGNSNVGLGASTLSFLISGSNNTAIGDGALQASLGSNNTALGMNAGAFSDFGSNNVFVGYSAGAFETGNNKLYIDNSNTSSPLIYGDFGTNVLTVNGNLGVGTTNPTQAKLVVNGSQAQTFASYGYLNRTHPTGTINGNTSSSDYSIYASDRIAAAEFNAYSDARIKNIKGVSNGQHDLQTLMGIEITDYSLKDFVAKGNKAYKKVIAQQVEKIYPQAVSKMTDVVPDIYQPAAMQNGIINLPNTLKIGDKVKLIFESGEEMATVTAATATSFTVNKNKTGNLFVYGREVNDFRSVDYEAISMLNVSATQELAKQLQQQQELIAQQQQQIDQLINELKKLRQPLPVSPGGAL